MIIFSFLIKQIAKPVHQCPENTGFPNKKALCKIGPTFSLQLFGYFLILHPYVVAEGVTCCKVVWQEGPGRL